MTAHSPNAYVVSALGHCAVVGLLLFFAYNAGQVATEAPKIMELVAGAGDNYAATAAPALGSPGGIKIKIAEPPPEPRPAASEPKAVARVPVPESSPLTPAPIPKNRATTATAAKPAARPPNFVADLKRLEKKREARLEAAYQKQLAAEEKRRKLEAAKISHIDAEGIKEGVIGGSAENKTGGAGGKALTREEGDLEEAYEALLTNHIKLTFEGMKPEGLSDKLTARVDYMLAADGSISGAHVARSSGNGEFDRAALESLAQTKSIGPRPDHRSETVSTTFKMHEEESP